MKKIEKQVKKILKKGFSIEEWKQFSSELKQNERIACEVAKKIVGYDILDIEDVCQISPLIIKNLPKEIQLNIFNKDNFKFLSEDLQMDIIEKNTSNVKYSSEVVQEKFAKAEPLKLACLSKDMQRKMIDDNNFYLEFALRKIQIEYANRDNDLLHYCSNMVQCYFIKLDPKYYSKCSLEVKRDIVTLSNLSVEKIDIDTLNSYLSFHTNNLSLDELIDYKKELEASSRMDKGELIDHLDYLIVNVDREKIHSVKR